MRYVCVVFFVAVLTAWSQLASAESVLRYLNSSPFSWRRTPPAGGMGRARHRLSEPLSHHGIHTGCGAQRLR
jgi:hypothetical protein